MIGSQFQDLCLEKDHFQKLLNPVPPLGRHIHKDSITTPFLGSDSMFRQLPSNPFRICFGFVNLVYSNHYGHISSLGMVHGLKGLGHDPIISSHDQNNQVSYLGPSGTHCRERLMTRRVEKHNLPVLQGYMVGSNMLGNSARLTVDDVGLPYRV